MFEQMIQLIEAHAAYGPAMKKAAEEQAQLVLDYHTHGGPSGYCVSITRKSDAPFSIMRTPGSPTELVHIKGVGEAESQCHPLMSALGRELKEHYQLEHLPVITLNGQPFQAPG